FVGEPIWHGRSPCETVEAVRHEALINTAFATATGTIVCPYDVSHLDDAVVADAGRTHPEMLCARATRPSVTYTAPLEVYAARDRPLSPPSGPVATLPVSGDLEALRRWIVAQVPPDRLDVERVAALVLAANEAVSNTLVHAGGSGTARIWHDDDEIVCEITDRGRVNDPLAGRRAPGVVEEGGRGLWLINQFCDLTELRSGVDGTVLRLHMSLVQGTGFDGAGAGNPTPEA
ncbi:MAG TPA: anti-sigma factor RsbA family regulatory protein, partial [Gaiellaceae bacterium]